MKIVCPSCQAQYEVPEVVLTSRRKMRCARCAEEWVPADLRAPEPPPMAEAPAAPADEPAPEPVAAGRAAEPVTADQALEPAGTQAFAAMSDADADADRPHPAAADELATMDDRAPSWADVEPGAEVVHTVPAHDLELQPVVPVEPISPPRPLALRPETPVGLRSPLPDPAKIVVPPAVKGPPVVEWAVSVVLVVALVAGIVIFRGPIMKVWPPSLRLYAALGMGQK